MEETNLDTHILIKFAKNKWNIIKRIAKSRGKKLGARGIKVNACSASQLVREWIDEGIKKESDESGIYY